MQMQTSPRVPLRSFSLTVRNLTFKKNRGLTKEAFGYGKVMERSKWKMLKDRVHAYI